MHGSGSDACRPAFVTELEVADGSDPELRLHGDYYREFEDEMRGLPMSFFNPQASCGIGPDDLLDGPTMDASAMLAAVEQEHLVDIIPHSFVEPTWCCKDGAGATGGSQVAIAGKPPRAERFHGSSRPPSAPADLGFAACRLEVSSTEPATFFNSLLDFLETVVVASIVKVNHGKFAVTANVIDNGSSCQLKARAYSRGPEKYTVEFQRRSGDGLCFGAVFEKAAKHLRPLCDLAPHSDPAATDGRGPPRHSSKAAAARQPRCDVYARDDSGATRKKGQPLCKSKADLGPLLDLAALEEHPCLQAEVATVLWEHVQEDAECAATLDTTLAIATLRGFLGTDAIEVAHPTALILEQLQEDNSATACFQDEELISAIAERVRSGANALVQWKLAQVLNAAIACSALAISEEVASAAAQALACARKDLEAGGALLHCGAREPCPALGSGRWPAAPAAR